jgi:outer membrane receptor protein involved in Fe transport
MDLTYGAFTFGYRFRYIGPMYVNAFEDFNELASACTAAGCPPNNSDFADIRKFPRVYYHDLRLAWDLKNLAGFGKGFQFYVGVDNLLDRHAPLGSTATGAGSAIYDVRGRSFYGGFRARF